MEITDVRVKLITDSGDRLKAVCAVTFDEAFVVRDVKVVAGTSGLFVAMPSRKVSTHCPKCGFKNAIRSRFCNDCGAKLPPTEVGDDDNGRSRFHRDIAHPITTPFREKLQAGVLAAYGNELRDESSGHDGHSTEDEPGEPVALVEDRADDREEVEEVSEYDAIIAGLRSSVGRDGGRPGTSAPRSRDKGGAAPPHRDERKPGSKPSGGSRPDHRSGDRPAREQSGERGSDRSGGRRRESENAPRDRRPRSDEPVREKPVQSAGPSAAQPEPTEGFGAGLVAEHTAPKRPVNETKKPKPAPPVEPVPVRHEDDDDGSFGEGIL